MQVPSRLKRSPWTPPASFVAPLATPRLHLRVLTAEDAEVYHRLLDADRGQLLPWMQWAATEYRTAEATRVRLAQLHDAAQADPTANRILGLFDRTEGHLVGAISLHSLDPAVASIEVGFWVASPYTRRGLAGEAMRGLISVALQPAGEGGWGLNKVHLTTAGANVAARGVARALGLRREMRRRQHTWIPDVGVDDLYGWGVLADEWDTDAQLMRRAEPDPDVGVGPHPQPWPEDAHLDPLLLRDGDRRNVADRYRYWRHERIVADLAARAHPFHVAIENWRHDSNIGTVVRNANAFGAAGVHIVGRRSWNRRGAMVTDRYLSIHHHDDASELAAWSRAHDLALVGIDNLPGSRSLHEHPPQRRCMLLLGQEGPGLSAAARAAADEILHIPQFGSTRSINAGVASGIAMATWVQVHADPDA